LVAGASEEPTLSDWTEETAVIKGLCFLKFWVVGETKLIGKEWVLLERMCLLEEVRVVWATIVVGELKVKDPMPSIVLALVVVVIR
jgi:hypothetical protein